MAGGRQPAGLVHDDGPRADTAADEAVELAAVGGLREQPQQVAGLGRADAEPDQRPLADAAEIHRPRQPCEIRSGRVLADAEVGLTLDADRDRRSGRGPARLVAAIHLRVGQAERAHRLVDAARAGRGRAGEPDLELVRGLVVREDDHPGQRARHGRPLVRLAGEVAEHRDGDRELQRRGGGEPRLGVPGSAAAGLQVLDVDPGGPAVLARERGDRPRQRPVEGGRAHARHRCGRQAEYGVDRPRRAPVPPVDRRHADGSDAVDRHAQRERPPSQRHLRDDVTAHAHDQPPRAGRDGPRDASERDLPRRRRDDRRRRQRWGVDHDLILALA